VNADDAHYWDRRICDLDRLARSWFLSAKQRHIAAGMRDRAIAEKKRLARVQAYQWGRHRNALHKAVGKLIHNAECDYYLDFRPDGSRHYLG
jgi:hypothetical protein